MLSGRCLDVKGDRDGHPPRLAGGRAASRLGRRIRRRSNWPSYPHTRRRGQFRTDGIADSPRATRRAPGQCSRRYRVVASAPPVSARAADAAQPGQPAVGPPTDPHRCPRTGHLVELAPGGSWDRWEGDGPAQPHPRQSGPFNYHSPGPDLSVRAARRRSDAASRRAVGPRRRAQLPCQASWTRKLCRTGLPAPGGGRAAPGIAHLAAART